MSQRKILLGVSGSIAAYKAAEIARRLMEQGHEVQVAMTAAACRFITPLTFEAITKKRVLVSLFEGDKEIDHVERAHDSDLVLLAPATANLIARLAVGMADDVISATVLATRAPVLLAPAMESGMWTSPATQENVEKLKQRGFGVIPPGSGALASGRRGVGRLAEVDTIVARVGEQFARGSLTPDLHGTRVLITAGPTMEAIDPVRVLTNRSTGAMGIALAEAALARGAEVTLILGPTHLVPSFEVEVIPVESADEMLTRGLERIGSVDVLIGAAAVSDFRPAVPSGSKLKRSQPEARRLELLENPDVIALLAKELRERGSPAPVVVGFAAETDLSAELRAQHARGKLERKGCDLIVVNRVGAGAGFGQKETEVSVISRSGADSHFGPADKRRVADFVLDHVAREREKLRLALGEG